MSFRVEDFHDLLRLLEERPEWRAELRRVVLTEDLLRLPEQLAQARQETDRRFGELAARIDALVTQVSTLGGHVGNIRGEILEERYRTRAFAYFGRVLRGTHALTSDELAALLEEAIQTGRLSVEEAHEVSLTDVVVRGRRLPEGPLVHLVVEVSVGVGLDDVRRAVQRAELLARAGIAALPAVGGEWLTPEAADAARGLHVWQITDGRVVPPDAPQV